MTTTANQSGNSQAAANNIQHIVALGDSLTWGYPGRYKLDGGRGILRRSDRAWPAQVAQTLNVEIINAGLNGDPYGGMLKRLDREVLIHKPQMVIVSGGSNDAAQGLEVSEIQERVLQLRESLEAKNIQLVWGIPPGFVPELVQRYWSDATLQAIERRRNELDKFREWLRRWALDQIDFAAALQSRAQPLEELLPDGIHPSDAAYDIMAEAAHTSLASILR